MTIHKLSVVTKDGKLHDECAFNTINANSRVFFNIIERTSRYLTKTMVERGAKVPDLLWSMRTYQANEQEGS